MNIKQLIKIKDLQTQVLFKNSSWVLGSNILRAVLVFLRGVIIARGLGVELFGTFNIIAAFAGLVHQFFGFPVSSTTIKYGADYLANNRLRELTALIKGSFFVSLLLAFTSTLVITGLTLFVYEVFFDDPDLETFVVLFAIITSSAFLDNLSKASLRLLYKFKEESIVVVVGAIIDLIIIGLVVFYNTSNFAAFFFAMIAAKVLSSILLNGVAFVYIWRIIKPYWKVPVQILKKESSKLISYTLNNSGSRALKTFMNNGDVLLLGALLGPAPVGFYNIAKKLAQSILIIIDPLTQTLFPQLSRLIGEKKYSEIGVMIKKVTRITLIPSLLVVCSLIFFREQIILFTYGQEYIEAAKPFIYLSINAVLGAILFWNLPLILSMGLVKFRLQVNGIVLIIGAIVAYLLTPTLGAVGISIGLLLANGLAILVFSGVTYSKLQKAQKE